MVAFGFLLLAYSTNILAGLTLELAPANVSWPNILAGFGTAFIFVPLTTLTMGTLSNEQMGNATGIFNLMRNLGGSVGIAMVTTFLARGAQAHQAALVGHLTPYDVPYQQWMSALAGLGGERAAQGGIYGQMLRQATLAAYIDDFRLLAFLCLLCVPVLLVFRKPARHGGPGPGGH
jgi:MFS transporter, DHA2 family, multidrug resistance protein